MLAAADFQPDDHVGMLLGHAQRRWSIEIITVSINSPRLGDQSDARDVEEGEDARAGGDR